MSVDHESRLVVGIEMQEIYDFEIVTEKVTKYNEDTGKPYQIEQKQLCAYFGNSKLSPVRLEKREYREYVNQDFQFLKDSGLDVLLPDSSNFGVPDYIRRRGLVGVGLDSTGGASLALLTHTADMVKKALSKFGYDGEVKVFSQMVWT